MFNRRLLCIILSIILGITPILRTFPVFATENSVVTENLSLYIQMMQKGEDNFEKNGSREYVSGLRIDDCVLIDLQWISNKLGLLVEITDIKENKNSVSEDVSYDIKKYQEGQEKVFSKSNAGKVILIRKSQSNYLPFILKTDSEKAYIYSPYLGEIIVDLGGKVIEQDGKIYVPFTMFLNLFDSSYILEGENVINLYPCETTVVDILHTRGLSQYYFDVIEDSGLSKLELGVGAGYGKFYGKIKALFQGVVNLDIDTLMKAVPKDKTVISELLSEMLLTNSSDEIEELVDGAVSSAEIGFLTMDFLQMQIGDGAEESLNETIRKWSEIRENNIRSTGFSSIDSAKKFEEQVAKEIANKETVKANIDKYCNMAGIGVGLVNIGFSAFIEYMTLVNEMHSAQTFYVDATKLYIEKYNMLQEQLVEKSIIEKIEEKANIYANKEKNILENEELLQEIFKDIGNTTASIDLSETVNYSAKKIYDAYPKFKLKEFSKTWLALRGVSIGWDVVELAVDTATNGSIEGLNALYASPYAMLLQFDSDNVLKSMSNYQNLEEYRKLEWIRLRSFYITRQLILMFYQPQQWLNPEEYTIVRTTIEDECNELIELMTVLAVGSDGISQEKMDENSKMRSELDAELVKVVEAQENILTKDDAELIWNEFLKTGDYITYTKDWDVSSLEYVITDINLDMIPELLIQAIDSPDFFNTWIFALENKEIVLITEIYGFGQFRYSQSQNLVIGSPEWKPFGGTGYSPFYKLEDTKLEFVFEIIQDEGTFYYSDSLGKKEINEDERKQFFSDVSYFEWESIQTLTSNLTKEDAYEKIEQYWKSLGKNMPMNVEYEGLTEYGYCFWGYNETDTHAITHFRICVNANTGDLYDSTWGEYLYINDETNIESLKDFDLIIESIRECYYKIQNQINSYSIQKEEPYIRYISNGIMRKIILYPSQYEQRYMTEEYYYDENEKLVFVFVYDNSNEFRYYFYNGLIYRYIDNYGNINDYENGKDPYEVENAGELYTNGELEKAYYYGH